MRYAAFFGTNYFISIITVFMVGGRVFIHATISCILLVD